MNPFSGSRPIPHPFSLSPSPDHPEAHLRHSISRMFLNVSKDKDPPQRRERKPLNYGDICEGKNPILIHFRLASSSGEPHGSGFEVPSASVSRHESSTSWVGLRVCRGLTLAKALCCLGRAGAGATSGVLRPWGQFPSQTLGPEFISLCSRQARGHRWPSCFVCVFLLFHSLPTLFPSPLIVFDAHLSVGMFPANGCCCFGNFFFFFTLVNVIV